MVVVVGYLIKMNNAVLRWDESAVFETGGKLYQTILFGVKRDKIATSLSLALSSFLFSQPLLNVSMSEAGPYAALVASLSVRLVIQQLSVSVST